MSRSFVALADFKLSREIPSMRSEGLINRRGLEMVDGEVMSSTALESPSWVGGSGFIKQRHRRNSPSEWIKLGHAK